MKKNKPYHTKWPTYTGKWKSPIRWTSETQHVDIDTGELLTKYTAQNEYNKIATDKTVKISENLPTGHIIHTNLYQRKKQLKLPFSDNK